MVPRGTMKIYKDYEGNMGAVLGLSKANSENCPYPPMLSNSEPSPQKTQRLIAGEGAFDR